MVKGVVKAVDTAITEASSEKAQQELLAAIPVIERAAVKGTLHKRNAARKVSRLTKRVNKFIKGKESAA
jgi:small subunit ribosomal protein S20